MYPEHLIAKPEPCHRMQLGVPHFSRISSNTTLLYPSLYTWSWWQGNKEVGGKWEFSTGTLL